VGGRAFSVGDINFAARVVFAEGEARRAGGTDEELYAMASVMWNRLQNPDFLDRDRLMHNTFGSVAEQSGQFRTVTGSDFEMRKFNRSDIDSGRYKRLSEAECMDLFFAMNAVLRLLLDGPGYDYTAFRGGTRGRGAVLEVVDSAIRKHLRGGESSNEEY
jgi:hypothetical protein